MHEIQKKTTDGVITLNSVQVSLQKMSQTILIKQMFLGAMAMDEFTGSSYMKLLWKLILIKCMAISTWELLTQVKDLMLLLQRLRRMSQELYTHIVMHILGI